MSPTSRKLFGVSTMRDCARLKRLSIQMTCFGAICALGMRAGRKLEIIYAEYRRKSKILG